MTDNTFDDSTLTVVQSGPIRLIGKMRPLLQELSGEGVTLTDVGAVILQRATLPGAIAGVAESVRTVKLVEVVTLDFARAPISSLHVRQYDFLYRARDLDPDGRKDLVEAYTTFLQRESSVVQHVRTRGMP